MKTVDSFNIQIWLGLREEYTDVRHTISEVYEFCQNLCNEHKLCVTVTPTRFIYVDGFEDGAIVGLINYPRFPYGEKRLVYTANLIANQLRNHFNQIRVSITTPKKTHCLGINEISE